MAHFGPPPFLRPWNPRQRFCVGQFLCSFQGKWGTSDFFWGLNIGVPGWAPTKWHLCCCRKMTRLICLWIVTIWLPMLGGNLGLLQGSFAPFGPKVEKNPRMSSQGQVQMSKTDSKNKWRSTILKLSCGVVMPTDLREWIFYLCRADHWQSTSDRFLDGWTGSKFCGMFWLSVRRFVSELKLFGAISFCRRVPPDIWTPFRLHLDVSDLLEPHVWTFRLWAWRTEIARVSENTRRLVAVSGGLFGGEIWKSCKNPCP